MEPDLAKNRAQLKAQEAWAAERDSAWHPSKGPHPEDELAIIAGQHLELANITAVVAFLTDALDEQRARLDMLIERLDGRRRP